MKSTDLCSQVVPSGQVLEPEQAVPVASPPSTRIVLHNLISQCTAVTQMGCPDMLLLKKKANFSCCSKTTAKAIRSHLDFPQCFAAGGRRCRLTSGSAQEDILFFPVIVTREKLLLLCVK